MTDNAPTEQVVITDEVRRAITNVIEGHDGEHAVGGGMYTDDGDIDALRAFLAEQRQ